VNPLKLLRKRDFYVEGVYSVISVKSSLNKKTFSDKKTGMLANLISAKKIITYSYSNPASFSDITIEMLGTSVHSSVMPIGFAYSGVSLKTIKGYLDREAKNYQRWWDIFPKIVVVLQKGLLYLTRHIYRTTKLRL
jgi:hypothetical protein